MSRKTKAATLAAIRDGRLKPSDLLEPVNYIVKHNASGYHWADQTLSESDYRQLLETYRRETSRRNGAGLAVGYFITVEYTPAPFSDGRPVTMDL